MPNNYLVTGPPRSGKTTAIRRTVDRLSGEGPTAGGVVCPEIREDGDRVGFEIRDVLTGDRAVMAHVDRETGPSVGKYRVDVAAVDRIAGDALARARDRADYGVVDEIAPMQVESEAFVGGIRALLDADQPLLAAVHERSAAGPIAEVRARTEAETFAVTPDTRDSLPATLAGRIRSAVE